jgi:hypothetical protein
MRNGYGPEVKKFDFSPICPNATFTCVFCLSVYNHFGRSGLVPLPAPLTLSALHAGAVGLPIAAAIVPGSNRNDN